MEYKKHILLERYLNQFKFLGVPSGSTLGDRFFHIYKYGVPNFFTTLFRFFLEVFWIFRASFKKKPLVLNTSVISTWIANKTHINNIINPLIDYYKDDITIIYNPVINKEMRKKASFVSIKETFSTPFADQPKIFLFFFVAFFSLIRKKRNLKLTLNETFYYAFCLFHQAKIISFYNNQFKKSKGKIRLVISEFDRNSIGAPLILTAKKFKIKTVTIVHGVIGKYGFTPVLADYIFCFGDIQKKQLLAQKVPSEKIKVTGTSIIELEKEKRKNKNTHTLKVGLGVSPIKTDLLNKMILMTAQAVEKTNGVELIVKLHPSHKKSNFEQIEKKFKKLTLLSSSGITNRQFFEKIDLLIVYSSGLGIEAMYQNVPVILIKLQKNEIEHHLIIANESRLPVAESEKELQELIISSLNNRELLENIARKGNAFAERYYHATGKDAIKNILSELNKISKL